MLVSLDWLKSHAVITESADDALLMLYERAAVEFIEGDTGIHLNEVTKTIKLDGFSDVIEVGAPLNSVSEIRYINASGVSQTLSTDVYEVEAGLRGCIGLKYGQEWPETQDHTGVIEIDCSFGYTAETLPERLKLAVMFLVTHYYENRDIASPVELKTIPMAYHAHVEPYEKVRV